MTTETTRRSGAASTGWAPTGTAPVTDRDREICARLAPPLRRHGIHLAGLDRTLCADVVDRALDGSLLLERTSA